MKLEVQWLGSDVGYEEALAKQEALVAAKIENPTQVPDRLLLLEHQSVYTIGKTLDRSSLLSPSALPHPVFTINRGGQATYHGPGQLVGYPILDLQTRGRDLHVYLRGLEEVLIETIAQYGVTAQRREGLTGVWIANRKIASLGVGVKRWISMHGFAVNIESKCLPGFQAITPCGIAGVEMTALDREVEVEKKTSELLTVKNFATRFGEIFGEKFG